MDIRYIEEHIKGDYKQLVDSVNLLRQRHAAQKSGSLAPGEWRAILESFIGQARILVEFLYSPKSRRTDVRAFDFLPAGAWPHDRSNALPQALAEVPAKAGKQVKHLTINRSSYSPTEYEWNVNAIEAEISREFQRFLSLVGTTNQKLAATGSSPAQPSNINMHAKTH